MEFGYRPTPCAQDGENAGKESQKWGIKPGGYELSLATLKDALQRTKDFTANP